MRWKYGIKQGILETTFEIEHIYARNRNEKENSLTDARNVESLGNKAYENVEDAEKRRDYLATYDGTIYANGTHTVIGTVLVRTSNELTATQQKELEQKVIDALTRLE